MKNNALTRNPKKKQSTLGMALSHYQSELGYTDVTLATLTLSDKSAVHKHKFGITSPSYNKLLDYARALKVNLSDIILKSEGFEDADF